MSAFPACIIYKQAFFKFQASVIQPFKQILTI